MNFELLIQNEIALERQLISILNSNLSPYISGKNYYNFRCNICGDSKKSKIKKRGYLIKKRDKPWYFYCHNGCGGMLAIKWMKEYYPLNYKEYINEVLSNKKSSIIKCTKDDILEKNNILEKDDVKFFIPILKGKGKLFEDAINLCKYRLIPENVWNKWFVAVNGRYKNRLIIPFYDNNNKIYYWQGKSLKDWMIPKYLSRIGDQFNNIYNYYNVNKDKEVIILEGPIDSIFVENSIALTGLKFYNEKLNVFKFKYFLLDNDEDGKDKSLKLLEKGEYVFNWNMFIKKLYLPKQEKWDINEVIIYLKRKEMFVFEELKPYFTNSIYDKINFLI